MHAFGDYSLAGNAAIKLDKLVLGEAHMYHGEGVAFDPEGILSTLPAIVDVLAGYLAGRFIRDRGANGGTLVRLLLAGAACIVLSLWWNTVFPINKKLWTSSFVLFTGGCALMLLAITYQVVEVRGFRRLGRPFEVLGLNAILVYMASEELASVFESTHFKPWLYTRVLTPMAGEVLGSLLFSLTLLAATWVMAGALYRRRLFLKV
jgi:predicted acyltransferase